MRLKSIICAAAALFATFSLPAHAEYITTTKDYPQGFIGAQGGFQMIPNGYAKKHLLGNAMTGIGNVYGGVQWNPVLATRLSINGFRGVEGYKATGDYYHFNYGALTADVMANIIPLFTHRDNNIVSVSLLGGVGGSKIWNESDWAESFANYSVAAGNDVTFAEYDKVHNRLALTEKLGAIVGFALSDKWAFNVEFDAFHHDASNHLPELNMSKDWQLALQMGVAYRFCKGGSAVPAVMPVPVLPAEEPAPVVETVQEVVVEKAPEPEPAPAPVVEEVKPCVQNVFFLINSYQLRPQEMAKVNEAVAYLEKYPNAKIEITGYADKNTGNATINLRLSKQRVNAVYNALMSKGVDSSRIVKAFKGDSVQPFANDKENYKKNRCVICVAE